MKVPLFSHFLNIHKHPPFILDHHDLRIVIEQGKVHLFWKSIEITKHVGFTSSLRLLDIWHDASETSWKIESLGSNQIKITMRWDTLYVSQTWLITLRNACEISWDISMHIEEERIIDECKIGLMLSPLYTQWFNAGEQGYFPDAHAQWQDIALTDCKSQCLGLDASSTHHLPGIAFNFTVNAGPLLPQLQNAPSYIDARIVSAYSLGLKHTNIYTAGHHKLASVELRIFLASDQLAHFVQHVNVPHVWEKENTQFLSRNLDADILLVMPPPWETKMPPLGIAYLAQYLKVHHFCPALLDLNVALFNQALGRQATLWDISTINEIPPHLVRDNFLHYFGHMLTQCIDEILASRIKVIGFSVTFLSILIAEYMAKCIKAKDPSRIIIFGGPGCFWPHDRIIISPNVVDLFIVGEAERPLVSVLTHLKKNSVLFFPAGTTPDHTQAHPDCIEDINQIPYPEFTEFSLSEYNKGRSYKPLPLLTSRGCIGRCSYCIDHKMNGLFRTRNPQHILEELTFHRNHQHIRYFELNDLLCNGNLSQLEQLCELIVKKGLDIQWTSYAMIRPQMTEQLLQMMHKAGCIDLCYGVESGSDAILKKMNKYYSARDAQTLIRMTHDVGIKTRINIIVGFPQETEKQFQETIQFILHNKNFIDEVTNISTLVINPGSTLGTQPEHYGAYLKTKNDYTNWHDTKGSDFSVRKKRVEELIALLQKNGIKTRIVNAPEG